MTDGLQRGRGLQTNGSGHRGKISGGGRMQIRNGQNVHGVLERLEVPQRRMAGMKDITDETREKNETPAQNHHKVSPTTIILTKLDEPHRYDRDRKPPPPSNSRSEPAKRTSDRKPPSTEPPSAMTETPSKSKPITSATLLEEEGDPPISKLMGFSRFSTTKGKKHEDYGAVDLIKKRTYRQYMNRPGGFNRPLD